MALIIKNIETVNTMAMVYRVNWWALSHLHRTVGADHGRQAKTRVRVGGGKKEVPAFRTRGAHGQGAWPQPEKLDQKYPKPSATLESVGWDLGAANVRKKKKRNPKQTIQAEGFLA